VYNDNATRPGLPGWTVELSGTVTASMQTDATGHYLFSGLASGTYTVCEVLQSAWHETFPTSGTACLSGFGYTFTLSTGNSASFVNFGNTTP
jgi:hypothetical protein